MKVERKSLKTAKNLGKHEFALGIEVFNGRLRRFDYTFKRTIRTM